MELTQKYQGAIDTAKTLSNDGSVEVSLKDNKLHMTTTVKSPTEKNLIWDKIKNEGGETPNDIMADIRTEQDTPTHQKTYIVGEGDTLMSISEKIFGDRNRYMDIYNENQNILSDPNKIGVGQKLVIPKS